MDNLSLVISENLKRVREEKKLSLDTVAKLSGVSKSMLGQIERCEVNPTVSTMWKIANGLKVSFSRLINQAETNIELIDINSLEPLLEDEGRVKIYPTFSFDSTRRVEIYSVEFQTDGYLSTEPHLQGTQEFLTVFSGEVTVTIGGKSFVVNERKAIRFKADEPHSYENTGGAMCKLDMVIYYPD
ncbi:helix-turn-helix domain-containing protein [Lacrimispora sp. AGF001]|uniref:helix-turn-helix domain-containing protein n=1 Tax=Lacrimispora sp. AGF001 TaxID=3401631 RepID=UPI003B42AC3F